MILTENKEKNEKIDCAIIKIEINNTGDVIEGYKYTIPCEDIEKTIKFIKQLFVEYNMPYYRIYLSGFAMETSGYIWTKERIVDSIKRHIIGITDLNSTSQSMHK